MSRIDCSSFVIHYFNFPQKITCRSGKLRTEFTSPIAKSTSPGYRTPLSLHADHLWIGLTHFTDNLCTDHLTLESVTNRLIQGVANETGQDLLRCQLDSCLKIQVFLAKSSKLQDSLQIKLLRFQDQIRILWDQGPEIFKWLTMRWC